MHPYQGEAGAISRADVAAFCLDAVLEPDFAYLKQARSSSLRSLLRSYLPPLPSTYSLPPALYGRLHVSRATWAAASTPSLPIRPSPA